MSGGDGATPSESLHRADANGDASAAADCTGCHTTKTACWRIDKVTGALLCNSCYNKRYPRKQSDFVATAKEASKDDLKEKKPKADKEDKEKKRKSDKEKKRKADKEDKDDHCKADKEAKEANGTAAEEVHKDKKKTDKRKHGDNEACDEDGAKKRKIHPVELEDCPSAIHVICASKSQLAGRYDRMDKPSEGRAAYFKAPIDESSKGYFLYGHGAKWLICQKLRKDESLAAAFVQETSSPQQVPVEPYPFPWTIVHKDKLTQERSFHVNHGMRLVDIDAYNDEEAKASRAACDLITSSKQGKKRKGALDSEATTKHVTEEPQQSPKSTSSTDAGTTPAAFAHGDESEKAETADTGASTLPAPTPAKTKTCPNCSTQYDDPPKFCNECGTSMVQLPSAGHAAESKETAEAIDDESEDKSEASVSASSVKSSSSSSSSDSENEVKEAPATTAPAPEAVTQADTLDPDGLTKRAVVFKNRCIQELGKAREKGTKDADAKYRWMSLTLRKKTPEELLRQTDMTPAQLQNMLAQFEEQYAETFRNNGEDHRTARPVKSIFRGRRQRPPLQGQRVGIVIGDGHQGVHCSISPLRSFRSCGEQLWFQNPGATVSCDTCNNEVPQTQGCLSGAGAQSQFAQLEFHCLTCHARKFGDFQQNVNYSSV